MSLLSNNFPLFFPKSQYYIYACMPRCFENHNYTHNNLIYIHGEATELQQYDAAGWLQKHHHLYCTLQPTNQQKIFFKIENGKFISDLRP